MIKTSSRTDLSELGKALAEIEAFVDANLSDVATAVKAAAKASAEFVDDDGLLRKSIKKKKSRFENGGYIVYSKAPHAHLVELGHVMIAWGRVTGKRVKPHPFLRKARNAGIAAAMAKFGGV